MDEYESTKGNLHTKLLDHDAEKSSQDERRNKERLVSRLQDIRVTVEEIRRLKKDPIVEYYTIRKLWNMCLDKAFRNHRKEIGDTLSECCYSLSANKMMKSLMAAGYYPQTCWAWLTNWGLWTMTKYVFDIADTFSYHSEELSKDFMKDGVLEQMVQNLESFTDVTPAQGSYHHFIIHSSLSTIKNIASSSKSRAEFERYNLAPYLQRLRTSMDEELRVLALSTLAFTTEVSDYHLLGDNLNTIPVIIKWMKEAIDNEDENRRNGEDKRDVCKLAEVLNTLAIEDNAELIYEAGGLTVLGKILNSTDVKKRVVASKCLCTLAFHKTMGVRITEDGELMKTLKTLEKIETHKELLQNVKSIFWLTAD